MRVTRGDWETVSPRARKLSSGFISVLLLDVRVDLARTCGAFIALGHGCILLEVIRSGERKSCVFQPGVVTSEIEISDGESRGT